DRRLDGERETLRDGAVELDSDRGGLDHRLRCSADPSMTEHGGGDAGGGLTQFSERFTDPAGGMVTQRDDIVSSVGGGICARPPEVIRQSEQALLGAVVKISLELPALLVAGGDDASSRVA